MPQFRIGEEILNGKYRIEKLLGEGAFGEVYLATHQNLMSLRALKVLRKEGEGGVGSTIYGNARWRFLQESMFGAQLGSQPHIIHVIDFDEVDNLMVLALEYAPGGSLQKRLEDLREDDRLLPVADALRIANETAEGLALLHNLDVVHRDLKPGNILFDKDGHAKVADFGLAQVPHGPTRRENLSNPPPHPGTPGYMSPEQKTPPYDVLTTASDIYALGAVLFEMLTGRSQYIQRPGTRPSEFRPGLPAELDDLVLRMLAQNPQERPWNGSEVARLLRAIDLLRQEGGTPEPARKAPREVAPAGLVECPICGSLNDLKETFRCKECGRAQLCREHRDKSTYLCEDCERARRKAEEREQERVAAEVKAKQAVDLARKAADDQAQREAKQRERERKAVEKKAKQQAADIARQPGEEQAKLDAVDRARKARENSTWIKLAEGVEMEFVRVPAGEFQMGSGGYDDPEHTVYLDEFWLGRYPVTNAQYAAFVKDSGQSRPRHWGQDGTFPFGLEYHPVVKVSWDDAKAFCEWLSRKSGQKIALPTEAQWEKAARGTDGRTYPWGNEAPDAKRCNFNNQVNTTTPMGKYSPQGDSPYGCADMAGNVSEWCADWYDEKYYKKSPQNNPPGPSDTTFWRVLHGIKQRVLRGGCYILGEYSLRSSNRFRSLPDRRFYSYGFRCARSIP